MNRNRLVFVVGVAAICIFILLSVVVLRFVSRREAVPEGAGRLPRRPRRRRRGARP
jgi:hypothetical protein